MTNQLVEAMTKVVSGLPPTVIIGLAAAFIVSQFLKGGRRRRKNQRRPAKVRATKPLLSWFKRKPALPLAAEPLDPLRTVMNSKFTAKPLLNGEETLIHGALEPLVAQMLPGWRLMAQVSLGEIVKGEGLAAHNSVNAKRVDFLIVDEQFRPRLAIEYQGSGHFQGNYEKRDAVKREALKRAGIALEEMPRAGTRADLQAMIERVPGRPAIATADAA